MQPVPVNTHNFQTPRPQFLIQAFCYKCVSMHNPDDITPTSSGLFPLLTMSKLIFKC